jgi:lipopolysaccharide export system protein LptC
MVWRFWRHRAAWTALGIALSTPGCQQSKQSGSRDVVPGLTLEGVRFRVYRGDALRASGEAARAEYRRDADELLARDLVATLPREGGQDVRLAATEGAGRLRARTFEARGGLTLVQGDTTARTGSARYLPGPPDLVQGDEPVAVEGGTWRLSGTGFTLEPGSGDLTVGGPARLDARTAEVR